MPYTVWTGLFLCILGFIAQIEAEDVHYYIAAEEVIWDYAPSGNDLVTGEEEYKTFLEHTSNRIGRRYKKAIYKEYTDFTFTQEIEKPKSMGLLGPIISGSVGQTLHIHFFNNASRNFSVHPHGIFYTKGNEGALYQDKTFKVEKADDAVPPKTAFNYTWPIEAFDSPTEDDPDCLPWMYHSHIEPVKDMNSGLMGMLILCKKGKKYNGKNAQHLLMKVMDENLSWYLDDNIKNFVKDQVDPENEDFQESNKMHSLNGLMYGNLMLEACAYDEITWYLMGMGNEVDIHTLNVNGHSFEYNHHRKESINLYPAQFSIATMKTLQEGSWLVKCHVHDHYVGGMETLLKVKYCKKSGPVDIEPNIVEYFIAAEEVEWSYSLAGNNLYDGGSLTQANSNSEVFFANGKHRIGGKYIKAIYQQYKDNTFKEKMKRKSEEEHLGALGPVIRATVGEIIKVVFYNKASRNYSIHPYGVNYNKFDEGSFYTDGADKGIAAPNTVKTYYWYVTKNMAPLETDPDCLTRMYASEVDTMKDTYSGLVGPLLICKKNSLDAQRRQKNIDKEFFLLFTVTDENNSWYLKKNIDKYTTDPAGINVEDEDFQESNLMHGINGYLYGNLPGLTMCMNDKVRWHIMAIGNEVDLHTVYFHGNTFTVHQNHQDTFSVLPGMLQTLEMKAINPGTWGVECVTNDHFNAGTKAMYKVEKCGRKEEVKQKDGKVRQYFIQAEEIEWDYAPGHIDHIYGKSLNDPENPGNAFIKSSESLIGSKYIKAVFRAYSSNTFDVPLPHAKSLGILGPEIIAEVGDTIKVVFKNSARYPTSILAHGVLYKKTDEGAGYSGFKDHAVETNKTFTYTWNVPESSGPGPKDPDCINYVYYSAVNPSEDTNAGLIGPLIICRKNKSSSKEAKHFPLLFNVFDENESRYLDDNIKNYAPKANKDDEDFMENNKNHAINGFLFGALPDLTMKKGEKVYWFLMGLGTEVDIHSVHFHGNTFLQYTDFKHRKDTLDLWPGAFKTIVMVPENPGVWLLHCHVDDHILGGMNALYTVEKVMQKMK
ncbi:hephaestin-like protein [Argonauta hians]